MLDIWGGHSKLKVIRWFLFWLAFAALVYFLYFWRLGSLTPGLSSAEVVNRQAVSSVHHILTNPLNAPHQLLQHYLSQGHGFFYLRLASVLLGLIFLVCYFMLCRWWFGKNLAYLTTLMLASTPWVVLTARGANADIMFLSPLAVLAAYYWLTRTKRKSLAWLSLCLSIALAVYTPGVLWFVLLGLILARNQLAKVFKSLPPASIALGIIVLLVSLYPLTSAIVTTPSTGRSLLLIPASWPGLKEILKATSWNLLALFWQTRQHLDFSLGQLPMLNAAQTILAIFGSYAMATRARRQAWALGALIVVSIIAAGLNENTKMMALAIPSLAILVGAGLRYLYVEWRSVFPRNPVPHFLAWSLVILLVGLHLILSLRYSLIAWPHNPITHHTYMLQ